MYSSTAIPRIGPQTSQLERKCRKHILCKSLQSFPERTMQACPIAQSKFSSKLAIHSVWKVVVVSRSEGILRTATHRERKVRDRLYPGYVRPLIQTSWLPKKRPSDLKAWALKLTSLLGHSLARATSHKI